MLSRMQSSRSAPTCACAPPENAADGEWRANGPLGVKKSDERYAAYSVDDSGVSWGSPYRNTIYVHSVVGHGRAIRAEYWAEPGDRTMSVVVALKGAPLDILKVGESFPDQNGTPYVIVEASGRNKDGALLYVARADVYRRAMDELKCAKAQAASRGAAAHAA